MHGAKWFFFNICYTYIQSVSRLQGITAGGDFLGLCDEKSSYKHVSDFGRLRSYDRFLIPVHALVRTAFTEPAGGIMNSASLVASSRYLDTGRNAGEDGVSYFAVLGAQFTTERQPVLPPAVAFSKTIFKHRSIQIKGNFRN